MANRDGKLILRTLKNISASIEVDGGGGTKVVTELPEVGELHTVYELHETAEPAYNWVAMCTPQMNGGGVNPSRDMLIFDTFEQMTSSMQDIHRWLKNYYAYLRNEDKLYEIWFDSRGGDIRYAECNKISNYIFEVNFDEYIYVLKSYEGYDEATDKRYGTLYDGTKVVLGFFDGINHNAFILHQSVFDCMNAFYSFTSIITSVTQLPTAQEAVANYLDDLVTNEGGIIVEIDGVIKGSLPDSDDYYFDNGLQNFYTQIENPVVYTGPLEWENFSYPIYNEIHYDDIDNGLEQWVFKPEQGGEKVSYWIYANNTWMNIDEISSYTANQIFVKTIDDYTGRPDRTITLVELDTSTEEPSVISEVPYKIIDDEHIIFYNVPYDKTLYLCIDRDLVDVPNTDVNSYDFNISFFNNIGNKRYFNFDIETIGGSIKVYGVSE